MKCIYCQKKIEEDILSLFSKENKFCIECKNSFETSFYNEGNLFIIYKMNDFAEEFLKSIKLGDYVLVNIFKDILNYYIIHIIKTSEIIYYESDILKEITSTKLKKENKCILVFYLKDKNMYRDVLNKYGKGVKILVLFANNKFINEEKYT